jgi:hypothetical protein
MGPGSNAKGEVTWDADGSSPGESGVDTGDAEIATATGEPEGKSWPRGRMPTVLTAGADGTVTQQDRVVGAWPAGPLGDLQGALGPVGQQSRSGVGVLQAYATGARANRLNASRQTLRPLRITASRFSMLDPSLADPRPKSTVTYLTDYQTGPGAQPRRQCGERSPGRALRLQLLGGRQSGHAQVALQAVQTGEIDGAGNAHHSELARLSDNDHETLGMVGVGRQVDVHV